jgi:hypothetical protein
MILPTPTDTTRPSDPVVFHVSRSAEQVEWFDPELGGDPFDRTEREVPFASFEAPHVGAVDADRERECLLRESSFDPVGAQVAADGAL